MVLSILTHLGNKQKVFANVDQIKENYLITPHSR